MEKRETKEIKEKVSKTLVGLLLIDQRKHGYTHIQRVDKFIGDWEDMTGEKMKGLLKSLLEEINNPLVNSNLLERSLDGEMADETSWLENLENRAPDSIGEAMGTAPVAESLETYISKTQVKKMIENIKRVRGEFASAR